MQNETGNPPKKLKNRFILGMVLGAVGMLVLEVLVFLIAFLIARPHLADNIAKEMSAPPLPAQQTDYDWTLKNSEGEDVELSEFRGKVLFITLWRPECPSCKAHLPAIQKLHDLVNDPDAVFLPVAVEEDSRVAETAEAIGLTIPYYVMEESMPPPFTAPGAPATFIVDRSGTIAMRHIGAARWDDPSVVEFMQTLLVEVPGAEPPPASE
jgi:peroxiredoxin